MGVFKRRSNHGGPSLPGTSRAASPGEAGLALRIGKDLLAAARAAPGPSISDKLMDWAMADLGFRAQLFRFTDVFPVLPTPELIHQHLTDYLAQPGVKLPPGLALGLKAGGVMKGTLARTVASQITATAKRFIAGADAESALPMLRRRWDSGIGFSVDLLGEACISRAEAHASRERYLALIHRLPGAVNAWPSNTLIESDHLGPIPRTNVSVKISSLAAKTDPIAHDHMLAELIESLGPILEAAGGQTSGGTSGGGVFVNFDMEQHALKDLTIDLFMRCCERYRFEAGLAVQAYLRSAESDVQRIIDWSRTTGRLVTVRLVKGAYWDYETIHAEQMGWPLPVWSRKADTDACFERVANQLIDATPRTEGKGGVKLALGSHNIRSIASALAHLESADLPPEAIEVQMLTGMADPIKTALIQRRVRVREYVPVGQMIPGMAYLVRRLLENSSNQSWLKAGFVQGMADGLLLAPPVISDTPDPGIKRIKEAPQRHALSPAVQGVGDGKPFFNEPLRDFSIAQQRDAFAQAIAQVQPAHVANDGTVSQAEAALARAAEAFATWRDTDVIDRANLLTRAADIMRSRRDELSGMIIKEAGKPWREADADVCEAIDFCEYYARRAVGLFQPKRLGRFVGELNTQWHQPRGVAAVISPWNFPLAICCGMTTAALVTGNTVIVKPAEQTPGIAKVMCDILWEAGTPRDVLQFLPGAGGIVGALLVRDPRVALIAFTGSKAVGLDILRAAGATIEGQSHVKRVICEMGGKNAIIVDDSADLDEAVIGVRDAAFGYSGQKCSACSRAIVLGNIHDAFLERLVESTKALVIGDPLNPATDVGPVIDADAANKIRSYIEIGRTEGREVLAMQVSDGLPTDSHALPYAAPHIFSDIQPHHRLANEEIFGPVLAVIRANSFNEAMKIANATDYKLTGGVYSRTPAHLEQAPRDFRVGNLYLNRPNTGALVGRQPFGGFGLSGTGTKAGGDDYLLNFVEPRTVTENTMRRGFAPDLMD